MPTSPSTRALATAYGRLVRAWYSVTGRTLVSHGSHTRGTCHAGRRRTTLGHIVHADPAAEDGIDERLDHVGARVPLEMHRQAAPGRRSEAVDDRARIDVLAVEECGVQPVAVFEHCRGAGEAVRSEPCGGDAAMRCPPRM